MNKVYLSKDGYNKLKDELFSLKKEKRPQITQEIAEARAHGDLKENAEYHAAREMQGMVEARIAELEHKLSTATIIDDVNIPADQVYIGATVTLWDKEMKQEIKYTLVSEDEADFKTKKISVVSPVAKALLGHKVGDKVQVQVPARLITYEIKEITRD